MKGITLVEVMIVVFIFSLIAGGLYTVLHVGASTYYTDLGVLDLQQQARNVMNWMVREIREAVSSSVVITPIDVDAVKYKITFDTPNETGIQYYLSANQIIREYPAGTLLVVGNNMTELKFTRTDRILQIQLRANKTVLNRPLSFSLTEQVRLRNE